MATAIKASDLQPKVVEESEPKKASRQILIHELTEGVTALERDGAGLLISGLSAGLDVGFSLLMMAGIASATDGIYSKPTVSLLTASMYPIGFLFVTIGRSELFTEQTTLAVLPVIAGKASVGALARLWGIVLASNLIGTLIFAWLTVTIAPGLGVATVNVFGQLAHRLTDHASPIIFGSAVLAGWLMGLLSWLVAAARDTISQIAIVWIVTAVIGMGGLHHAVVGSTEVLAGVLANSQVSWIEFGRFLAVTVLGNAVGGSVFVALIKYSHAVRGKAE